MGRFASYLRPKDFVLWNPKNWESRGQKPSDPQSLGCRASLHPVYPASSRLASVILHILLFYVQIFDLLFL